MWIGKRAIILKGSNIPDNSIIGAGAIYTKSSNKEKVTGGCIFAGQPAKPIKKEINWDRRDVYYYLKHGETKDN